MNVPAPPLEKLADSQTDIQSGKRKPTGRGISKASRSNANLPDNTGRRRDEDSADLNAHRDDLNGLRAKADPVRLGSGKQSIGWEEQSQPSGLSYNRLSL